jgi:hypothetical protein
MTNPVQYFLGYEIMVRCHKQPLGWVFVSRMIGIICLLIVIVLANILNFYIASPVYHSGVVFLNENFWLLLLISIIMFVGDLFGAFPFPLNLPFPIIRAIGSVFVIAFILRVFQWTDSIAGTSLYQMFWLLSFLIVPLVFLIVLASGYFEIMRLLWWVPRVDPDNGGQVVHQAPAVNQEEPVSDAKSWEEIGVEFRLMLYDLLHRFRQEIKRK